jgi:sulfur-oxidizing protein SoxZ
MARRMKVRTRTREGIVEILILISHPMETGLRKDKKTKKRIPRHFIQKLFLYHNGEVAAEANFGMGVSADPLIGFRLDNATNGDPVKVSWSDNKGESGSFETKVVAN